MTKRSKYDHLTDPQLEELAQAKKELEIYKLEDDYYLFFKKAWPCIEGENPLIDAPHIKYLCRILGDQVKKIAKGEGSDYKKIIINIPPSTSKSSIVTKILPVWVWVQNPEIKMITSSFDGGLATDHTVKSRDIITSEWFQERWGDRVQLKSDQNEKKRYYNSRGGIRRAVTTQGPKTGFHAHIYIEDDPIDPHRAVSEVKREEAIRDHDKVIPSRVLPGGLRIIVMQRVHEEDTTGHALSKNEKEGAILHICLPAEQSNKVSPPEAEKIYTDGILDPHRLGRERLEELKTDLGTDAFAAQYDQTPTTEGGNKIKEEWIQYKDRTEIPDLTWDLWIDGAYTKKTENDPTGLMIAAKLGDDMIIKHFEEARREMPDLLKRIDQISEEYGLTYKSKVYVEPKASGKTIVQLLKEDTALNPVEISTPLVSEGKEARIQAASPKFEAGRIYLITGHWNDTYVHQVTKFPKAKHDEAVDLTGYAVEAYFKKKKRRGVRY